MGAADRGLALLVAAVSARAELALVLSVILAALLTAGVANLVLP